MKKNLTLIAILIVLIALYAVVSSNIKHSKPTTAIPTNPLVSSASIPVTIISQKSDATSSPSISIEYPQFPSLSQGFNGEISDAVNSRLDDFKKEIADNEAARRATANPKAVISPGAYSFIASWQQAQINGKYLSFVIRFDSFTGGANENQDMQTFNYDVSAKKDMTLADLFPNTPDYLNIIASSSRKQLMDEFLGTYDIEVPIEMVDAGTQPIADNFSDFTFNDYQVTFYFPKYAVAPGSFGEQQVKLPRNLNR